MSGGDQNYGTGLATMGPLCPICGGAVFTAVGHGWGVCKAPERTTERYLGVTPDQMRQIVREELDAMFKKYGIPQDVKP